jgi:hypothetical protein
MWIILYKEYGGICRYGVYERGSPEILGDARNE